MNKPEQPRYSAPPSVILTADQPTGEQPMELFITDEHTEEYLAIQAGDDAGRGQITGLGGWALIGLLSVGIYALIRSGEVDGLYIMLGLGLPMFLLPLLWETLRPLPLPTVFNRRTREVYFDHNGVLFHTPWDGILAMANEFQMVGPQIGGMRCASLEIRVWQFENPETALMVSLGSPLGKSLGLQKGFWEYIRSYMNNGPWFDEQGNHSESDAFVKSHLAIRPKMSDSYKRTLARIRQAKHDNGGRNYLESIHVLGLALDLFFYPWSRIQELTYSIAKRRSRNLWPKVVTERLKPNGPTTRLIDLEREKGIVPPPPFVTPHHK